MKLQNAYAAQLSHATYRDIPKAVFAAIAVSACTMGGEQLDTAERRVMAEWWTLHRAGIVPQKPFGPELQPTL